MGKPVVKNYIDPVTNELVIGGAMKILPEANIAGMQVIRKLNWTAAQAVAADADGIHAAVAMGAAASEVTSGFTAPPCPRNVSMTPSVNMGTAKKVAVHGLNADGEAISEELTFNSASAVVGNKAFASVYKLVLPIQEHAPVAQVETAAAAGTVATAGRAKCTVTCNGMPGSPLHVPFDVALGDDAAAIAAALRAALIDMDSPLVGPVITAWFDVSGEDANVVLTRKAAAADDTTLNIAISDGEGDGASVGVTTKATSTTTTPGVAPDVLTLGFGDKLGLGIKMSAAYHLATSLGTSAEENAAALAVSATALESNTVDLSSALNGSAVQTVFVQL